MPALTIPNSFVASTIAQSALVNANFSAVATLLNTTKLDSTNIQTGGIVAANLASDAVTTAKILDANVTLAKLATAVQQAVNPTGTILEYAGTVAPTGYLLCQGQAVSRTTYSALFAITSTAYGTGDGATTFNVPDKRGTFSRGLVDWTSQTFATTDVNTGTDVITLTGNTINRTGFPVRFSTSSGLPAPLAVSTTYYVIVTGTSTIKVATSEANAIAGTAIDITTTGAGTHTITQYADPDAATRTAMAPGGSTGRAIGAVQDSAFTSHNHTFNRSSGAAGSDGGTGVGAATLNDQGGNNGAIAFSGGTETRPRNTVTNYIIKT